MKPDIHLTLDLNLRQKIATIAKKLTRLNSSITSITYVDQTDAVMLLSSFLLGPRCIEDSSDCKTSGYCSQKKGPFYERALEFILGKQHQHTSD